MDQVHRSTTCRVQVYKWCNKHGVSPISGIWPAVGQVHIGGTTEGVMHVYEMVQSTLGQVDRRYNLRGGRCINGIISDNLQGSGV